jgi:mono/diheme cytochrome c family protein
MEVKYKRLFQLTVLICSCVFILFMIASGIRESLPEWKKHQREYKEILVERSQDARQLASANRIDIGVRQVALDELGRIDRCQTCHLGMDDVRMADQNLPYRAHTGEHLVFHPIADFGCTVCHKGQGQAVDKKNAHARTDDVRWAHPMLALDYTQSACGQCHLAIFRELEPLAGTEIFQQGLHVFRQEGCLGCHKARGVGSTVGPDLTEQGKKTRHEYDFAHILGDQTVTNWLYSHFKDPEMVSPGSQMLAIDLADEDLQTLITFTLGMAKPEIAFEYFSIETLEEFKGQRGTITGADAFPMICSACHGKAGEGKRYKEYKTGIAGIGRSDFLSVASTDFIAFTIYHGRSGRQMAAWMPRYSGLKMEEIGALADFVKSKMTVNSEFASVQRINGNLNEGERIYKTNCAMCHGDDGRGTHIITISNPGMMSVASDEFLYKTIVSGRRNTAMPGWGEFSSEEMADILAFLRDLATGAAGRGVYYSEQSSFSAARGDVSRGEEKYHYLCSRCHGIYGQGDTGPAIFNPDFQNAATDYFLSEMIAKGRQGTAMIGWSMVVSRQEKLSASDIADVIAFLRHSSQNPLDVIYPGPIFGSAEKGRSQFQELCIECHGQLGEGLQAPALNNQELLNAGTNGYLFATISRGRSGAEMPSWGRGSDKYRALNLQERHDIVAFIRQWQKVVIKKMLKD